MKCMLRHVNKCPKPDTTCSVCNQMSVLSHYHAKQCTSQGCPVPFCQKISQRLHQFRNFHQKVLEERAAQAAALN